MLSSTSTRHSNGKIILLTCILGILMVLLSACVGSNDDVSPGQPTLVPEVWRESIAKVALPKKGCFQATYPVEEWQEVSCVTPPPFPMPPRTGTTPLVVGNGNDISAEAPTGFISMAIGSFDSVTGVTSVTGMIAGSGSPVANAYTLQMNTNFFSSTACAASPNPACEGWEQFVFYNDGSSGMIFIQYWLLHYNDTCPSGAGWNQFTFSGGTDIYCYRNNSAGATPVPNQPITNLSQLVLTGEASATGDRVTFSTGTNAYSVPGDNSVNAAAGWQMAEFNVFGPGGNSSGGSEATFNSGAQIVPRTRVFYGGTAAPNCVAVGFTGETNNLSFGPTAPASSPPGPAVFFTESTAGGATSNCAAATTIGDTHLVTFGKLFYDFQASGDFVLVEVKPDFEVQARQVSGAPTWPNASVNSAVATRMGKVEVAICLDEPHLNIDGRPTELKDGSSLSLSDGVDIWRIGNAFLIRDQKGNSLRATVNTSWINATVGLGRWPVDARGLLMNANEGIESLESRDGTVLTAPFPFEDLYYLYGDSWRVPLDESLLSVCGEDVERGAPDEPFYTNNLDEKTFTRAQAICLNAGVEEGPLLDACTLDVAVIGDEEAANGFADIPAPKAIGLIE